MQPKLFTQLTKEAGITQAHPFSQQLWRKRHYPSEQCTLCSGLTRFWLEEKMQSRDALSLLKKPKQELLRYISSVQSLSYYHDLSVIFHYASATIEHFTTLATELPQIGKLPAKTLLIGVLRYLTNGQPDGHRIAYYCDRKNQHHFFDPNNGEVSEPDNKKFMLWLNLFLTNVMYRHFEPDTDNPFLTLYILTDAALQNKRDTSLD
ncbi:MAG: YopT-type cysteine protease domain-containing protein [Reinekea sp.]